MNLKVNSKELSNTLSKVFPAVPTKTPIQILENFYVEAGEGKMTFYATDMEMAIKSSLNAVTSGEFKAVIPARKLYDTMKALNEDTTLTFETLDNERLKISWNKGEYLLSYLPANEFPKMPAFPTDASEGEIHSFVIDGDKLKKAIDKTAFAISKESFRPAMMGILFEFNEEGLRFVSTDGHRLINILYKDLAVVDSPKSYVVPGDVMMILQKVLDEKQVKVLFSNSHASFILDELELITRLIDEKYPDYKSVIPLENEFTLTVSPGKMLNAAKRVILITSDKIKRVKLNLAEGNEIEISAEDMEIGDMGKERFEASYVGEPMEIGFNGNYLSDVLSHLSEEEEIVMKLNSPNKAVLITPKSEDENQELTMLLMPVRLNV